MAKGGVVIRGVFKDMLDDLLRVADEGAAKGIKNAGAAAGKESAQGAAKAAGREVKVPFKLTDRMKPHAKEMRRQLDRQLAHFDGKTPKEIIDAMENPAKRSGTAQKEARERFAGQMENLQFTKLKAMGREDPQAFSKALSEFGIKQTDNRFADAQALAKARTDGFMKTVAALHEPDIVAGGLDKIGKLGDFDSFGLSNVNSSIGSQWRNVKDDLLTHLKTLDPDTPVTLTHPL